MRIAAAHAGRGRSAATARPSAYLDDSPWLSVDRARLRRWVAVGVIVNVIAWYGASGSTLWSTQTRWIVLSMVAAAVAAVGCGGWLLAGLRSIAAARAEVLNELRRTSAPAPVLARPVVAPAAGVLVAGPRMTRFHRADCRLVSAKDVGVVGQAEVADRRLQPCGVCLP